MKTDPVQTSPANPAVPRAVTLHNIGGLHEGAHARTDHWYVGVCRRWDGSLIAARGRVEPLDAGAGSWPFVRGVVCQLRQWLTPVSPQHWAASLAESDATEAEDEKREATSLRGGTYRRAPSPGAIVQRTTLPPRRSSLGSSIFSATYMVIFLLVVPQALATWALKLAGVEVKLGSATFQLATGLLWPAWFALYNALLVRSPGIRRVYEYNTAAFKVLVAHELRRPLTLPEVRGQSPLHPSASLNYFAIMMFLSPAVFYLAGQLLPEAAEGWFGLHMSFVALKVAAMPILFSLTYEIQRGAARLFAAGYLRWAWPFLCFMQRLWTLKADDAQIEVAIVAAQEAIALETGAASDADGG